jgi:hypothetical protein
MTTIVTAFAGDAWSGTVDSVFPLTAEPRRKAAVGIHCGSSADSAGSVFVYTPKALALSPLRRTGLGITPVPISEDTFIDACQDLPKIEVFHVDTAENRSTLRIGQSGKMRAKHLSSNQLFLGIIFKTNLEQRLLKMHSNPYLRVRELQIRARSIAPSIRSSPSEDWTRQDLLRWLCEHRAAAEALIASSTVGRRMASGIEPGANIT